jgi:hypothetical protein
MKEIIDLKQLTEEDLHLKASKHFHEAHHLVFQLLPSLIAQIIENKTWKHRNKNYNNFGEYALDKSSDGLEIINNNMLWLLKTAMDIEDKIKPSSR